jgi:L-Ala-D/L-Glu epimerase
MTLAFGSVKDTQQCIRMNSPWYGLKRAKERTVYRAVGKDLRNSDLDALSSLHFAGMSSPYRLDFARYRLLFRHPFGTAHGMRDGTDAVFVRLTGPAGVGYGEAALPPYVKETPDAVIELIRTIDPERLVLHYMKRSFQSDAGLELRASPAARAVVSTAVLDYLAREAGMSVASYLAPAMPFNSSTSTSVTLGHGPASAIEQRISELPQSDLIKIKLGGPDDIATLETVQACDQRPLFLDANQAWKSVGEALGILQAVEPERLRGMEQPFGKDRWDMQAALQRELDVPVFGDESIQGMEDLERAVGVFQGVNLKLIKCGGLDVAVRMAERAKELGLQVMLGCMSESTLGCAAMAQLQPMASILDLDGPWLVRNDPFVGLRMAVGSMELESGLGLGVDLVSHLDWRPIGA